MVETWLKRARQSVAGLKPFRWMRILPPGIWIIIAAAAFIGGRIAWLKASRPAHLKEITAAFGSVSLFQDPAQFNHDLTKFICVTTTESKGVGLFLCETATGSKRLLDTQVIGPGPWQDDYDLKAWPWSPDDSAFVYSMTGTLVIRPLDTNIPPTRMRLGVNDVLAVVWLNPSEFVWLEKSTFGHARKPFGGPWDFQRLALPGRITGLTAIDSHTVGWAQDSYICRFDFAQDPTGDRFLAAMHSSATDTPPTNDLVLWLDASTLHLSNNATVTSLADLSVSRNTAINNRQPPTFNAPGSASALNGRGTIHFSSSNAQTRATGLVTSKNLGITGNEPRTVYAVMRREVGRLMIAGFGNAGVRGAYFGVSDQFDGFYLPATMAADNKAPAAPRNWNILLAVCDGKNENGYVNGELKCTAQFPLTTTNAPVEIGMRTVQGGPQWRAAASDGDFAELLVYNRVLSRLEQRQVEKYLSSKWFGVNHISSQNSLAWCDTGFDEISGFLYSSETGQFLIETTNVTGSSLCLFNPSGDAEAKTVELLHDRTLGGVQWSGPGEFIYAGSKGSRRALFAGDATGIHAEPLVEFQSIGWFKVTPNGDKIMVWGVLGNEPAESLWEYDAETKKIRSVAAYAQTPSGFARKINSSTAMVKLPSGASITCTVFTPPNFDRNKKYPLVLGDTYVPDPIHGHWLQSGMAAAGAFVIFVDRPNWGQDIEKWEENVRAVYEVLRRDPSIDTERVFLIGASAETFYMKSCVEKAPGLWKGMILLNPSSLPDFSKAPVLQNRPRILISAGSEEHEEALVQRFQREALRAGALVEYTIHPTEGHRFVGINGKLARLQAINHFIFEE